MDVGFTGTQKGMTPQQKKQLEEIIFVLKPSKVRYGDCIGADEEFHDIVDRYRTEWKQNVNIIIHPPFDSKKRAFKKGDVLHEPKAYLDRNQDIASECQVLIATPKENYEVVRSGTWATIRRAREALKRVIIIWPHGKVDLQEPKQKSIL